VGLQVFRAFQDVASHTVGYDPDEERVDACLTAAAADELPAGCMSAEPGILSDANHYVVVVPTPVDLDGRPDLRPLEAASGEIGARLSKGDVVVFESTVFPGVTEEICAPILEAGSGLKVGHGFGLGYSPERVDPGNPERGFADCPKLVAASDAATLKRVVALYERVVAAGVHRAPSIRVAEAAKLLENAQRDVNIALVNQVAGVLDRIGVDTREVLDAAGTKWNFSRFTPGLVGGPCVSVDPLWLIALGEDQGAEVGLVREGRRVNDAVAERVAEKTLGLLGSVGVPAADARILVLGLAFKPGSDTSRDSRVPDLVRALERGHGAVCVVDPRVDPAEAMALHGIELSSDPDGFDPNGVVLAVGDDASAREAVRIAEQVDCMRVLVDLSGEVEPGATPAGVVLWRL